VKRLVIVGGAGRMGQALAEGLSATDAFEITALIDVTEPAMLFGAQYAQSLEDVLAATVDVVIDFSTPDGVALSARWCARHRIPLVIGATGLDESQRALVDEAATRVGVVMASNFSIGAVLAERFAALAAPYFESVEVIELHHDRKVDAPSGTSIATSRSIQSARSAAGLGSIVDPTERLTIEGARGADAGGGVRIHSVRLPGLVAHQEILFGGPGEGLSIRHDTFDRNSFVLGVALAANAVDTTPRLLDGIASLVN
jgi:4-hydroxy-tetrahydrodipicolinate reductase